MNVVSAPTAAQPLAASRAEHSRLAEIEVLRAVAVLMVLVQHIPDNLIFWPSHFAQAFLGPAGFWTGVDLFFVISGFVIARSLLPRLAGVKDWPNFTRIALTFWIARAWRLLPSAWLWLTLPLILCLIFNHSHAYGPFGANWSMFVAGILDVANFHFAEVFYRYPSGTAFVQWSLSLEEQFYFLLPFAAFFCGRYLFVPLGLIALAGFFMPVTPLMLMLRLWPVAFGVLLALWARHSSYRDSAPTGLARSRLARAGLLVLAISSLASLGATSLHIVPIYPGPVALVSAVLVWVASYDAGYLWREGFSRRMMEAIAARSYSLYLIHIPVYFGVHELWYRLHKTASPNHVQALGIIGSAALGLVAITELNHRLLEKPLRAHGKRVAARFRESRMAEAI